MNFMARNPGTGENIDQEFDRSTPAQLDEACRQADGAFDEYRAMAAEQRAGFLELIAAEIEAIGDHLIITAMAETALPRPRLEGERARTCGQLRLFAARVRDGDWQGVRIDQALPDRKPLPRPDLRMHRIPVGPVAVFGASNFPLAFSVAGGDTASAFAAGCPVVVKAHPAHPGTSALVGDAVKRAAISASVPAGVFAILFDDGFEIGEGLVKHPAIQAVGFTGSQRGGLALVAISQQRRQPIPVYAEMSSVNPVFLLPAALQSRGATLATAFVDSLVMGVGQFCTNPGVVIALRGPAFEAFKAVAVEALKTKPAGVMLSAGIAKAYREGVVKLLKNVKVDEIAQGEVADFEGKARPVLFEVSGESVLADATLIEEVFGPCAVLIGCEDEREMLDVARSFVGQLTATLQLDDEDNQLAGHLVPVLERKVGRILFSSWPTGVEVCDAMVHGGPYPATSDGRSTSVGTAAIDRFLRPVSYQSMPAALLPQALRDANELGLRRLVDGQWG
jgi:alpha-ketoglutaric semialdehyde dehydrogenase